MGNRTGGPGRKLVYKHRRAKKINTLGEGAENLLFSPCSFLLQQNPCQNGLRPNTVSGGETKPPQEKVGSRGWIERKRLACLTVMHGEIGERIGGTRHSGRKGGVAGGGQTREWGDEWKRKGPELCNPNLASGRNGKPLRQLSPKKVVSGAAQSPSYGARTNGDPANGGRGGRRTRFKSSKFLKENGQGRSGNKEIGKKPMVFHTAKPCARE